MSPSFNLAMQIAHLPACTFGANKQMRKWLFANRAMFITGCSLICAPYPYKQLRVDIPSYVRMLPKPHIVGQYCSIKPIT